MKIILELMYFLFDILSVLLQEAELLELIFDLVQEIMLTDPGGRLHQFLLLVLILNFGLFGDVDGLELLLIERYVLADVKQKVDFDDDLFIVGTV